MPTINEVKKRKIKLEQTIFDSIKDFEKDGVTIDYINIKRNWDYEEEIMARPTSEPDLIITSENGGIIGVRVELKIDLGE